MDNRKKTLERILTTGSSHAILRRNLSCIWPLTLDYRQQLIYWTNTCSYRVESLHINGTNHSIVIEDSENLVSFSNGITEFDGVIYWSTPKNLYMKSSGHVRQIYSSQSSVVLMDLQLVHPRSQPTGTWLYMYLCVCVCDYTCGLRALLAYSSIPTNYPTSKKEWCIYIDTSRCTCICMCVGIVYTACC